MTDRDGPSRVSWALYTFGGLALVLLARLPPLDPTIDGQSMYAVANSIVTGPSLHVPCSLGHPAPGGCVSSFYPLLSVVMLPFVVIGRAAGHLFGLPPYFAGEFVAGAVPALAAAVAATTSGAIAGLLGATRRLRVAVAVGCALGTEVLTYAGRSFAETLGAACLSVTVWGGLQTGRRRWIGPVAAGMCVLAKPQLGPAVATVALLVLLLGRRWRPALELAAGALAGVLLYAVYNALRAGSATTFSSHGHLVGAHAAADGLFVRAAKGVGVLLVSPSYGLLWYSPLAAIGFVGLWRARRQRAAVIAIGASLAVFAVYVLAPYGNGWGTRYLVPAIPLMCAGIACLPRRGLIVAASLAGLTAASQIPNLIAYYEAYPRSRTERLVWSVPHTQLVGVWGTAVDTVRLAGRVDQRSLVAYASGHSRQGHQLYALTIAQWWWLLPAAGVPAWVGAALAAVMALAGGASLVRAARGPPRREASPPDR